jgi:SAM-dependent methyltransferase
VDLDKYYASFDERSRLTFREGHVEYLRTRELLERRLPPPPRRVLDIGGADGVHAAWLAELGYDVEVIDIVSSHVDAATARGLRARVGDATRLDDGDGSADVVLLLGPLYHLPNPSDRAAGLREAHRVLRPGGLIAVAAISRISAAVFTLRHGDFAEPDIRAAVDRIVAGGYNDTGRGVDVFYFHTADELGQELKDHGFGGVEVYGLEGPAWPLIGSRAPATDPVVEQVVEIARLADTDPATVGASAHLLAIGQRGH